MQRALEQEGGQLRAVSGHERNQLGEAFFERPGPAFGVPDEVTDSKRSEVFSAVPGSQAGGCTVAFVLPDFLADPIGFARRERSRGGQWRRVQQANRNEAAADVNEHLMPP